MRVCSEQDIITTAIKLMLSSCMADVLLNSSYIISECFVKYLRHLRSSVPISLKTDISFQRLFSEHMLSHDLSKTWEVYVALNACKEPLVYMG